MSEYKNIIETLEEKYTLQIMHQVSELASIL